MAAPGENNNTLSPDGEDESSEDTFEIPAHFEADVSRILDLCPYEMNVVDVVNRLRRGEEPLDIVCWWRSNVCDGREWEREVEIRFKEKEMMKKLEEEESSKEEYMIKRHHVSAGGEG